MPGHGIRRTSRPGRGQQVAASDTALESSGVAVGVGVLDDFVVFVGVGVALGEADVVEVDGRRLQALLDERADLGEVGVAGVHDVGGERQGADRATLLDAQGEVDPGRQLARAGCRCSRCS